MAQETDTYSDTIREEKEATGFHSIMTLFEMMSLFPGQVQYSKAQTAKLLGIPLSTLEAEMRKGDAPTFFMVGRRLFTTIGLIREWQNSKISEAKAT